MEKNKEKFKIFLKNLWGGGFGRSRSFAEPKPNRMHRPKQKKSFGRTELRSYTNKNSHKKPTFCKVPFDQDFFASLLYYINLTTYW